MTARQRSAAREAATRVRDDLAEAFARVLLSDGMVGSQAPVFFLEPDGTMIWANEGYYGLATLLANAPEAQRLLHPSYSDGPGGETGTWTASAPAMLNGRPVIVRASYAKLIHGARRKPALAGFVQVAPDERDQLRDLAVARERANDIMRLVSDWVWETDAEGNLTFASDRVQRTTGFHPQELIGTPLTRLAAGSQAADALLARLMTLAPFRDYSVHARAKDGGERILLISAVPVFEAEGGAHSGFRGTASDITGLSEREQSILAAKEAAEQANRAKAQFLSNMSHELRTPLNAIIGFSEMMAGAVHGPLGAAAYGEYANDINTSARHLLAIINDILEVAKIEAGRLALVEEETSVADLCSIALRLVKERAEERSVRLRSEAPQNLPNVVIDQRAMRQVLLNLLSNAVKFTRPGGEVTLRAQLAMDGDLMLQVCDTGIGMREEDLNRVLQPFVQGEAELGRKFEGTGIGLSLSKQLIELHGGRLGIVSKPDFGTTVTVYLPSRRLVATAAA
jgi:PAS domain S-box-containing protein